jgi:protein required for attachment to host cells
MTTWVIVASAARARFFELANRRADAIEVADLVNPEDRFKGSELQSDRPGRAFDSHGDHRHAMGSPVDPKEQLARQFAKQVLAQAEDGLSQNRFANLCIVASPHFLGLLRESMSPRLAKVCTEELDKDLTRARFEEVREHLPSLS